MNQGTNQILFLLLRSAVRGVLLTEDERAMCAQVDMERLCVIAKKHDVLHLLALGLKQNKLLTVDHATIERSIFKAVYRHQQHQFEFGRLCDALETAHIPFLPLKGAILRQYYPEPWMRTSCDIDVFVRQEDLDRATLCLVNALGYEERERAMHDISFFSENGTHVELHFDLVEENCANNASKLLRSVWEYVTPCEGYMYRYQMTDEFFYFYHVAHMAKHVEFGGCGIRPFIDLWILDHMCDDPSKRDALLSQCDLLQFTGAVRALSRVWMDGETADERSLQLQKIILQGGAYGSMENRVLLKQKKKGGKIGYIWSRVFLPYDRLKRYYPVLEKHRWLVPLMQIRRWFRVCNPAVAKRAKAEMMTNRHVTVSEAEQMNIFLQEIGLK